jgi:hypothetical protein
MEGFVVFDYADRYEEAACEMAAWAAQGILNSSEEIVEGLERFPETFLKLFNGEHFGKLVLRSRRSIISSNASVGAASSSSTTTAGAAKWPRKSSSTRSYASADTAYPGVADWLGPADQALR